MGKKSVVFCDLTKQEVADEATLVSIVIKIPGKKQGRTYELSAAAAAVLEQQLVAGNKLPDGWSFGGESRQAPSSEGGQRPRTLGDLDTDTDADEKQSDSKFVAAKKREMQEEGVDTEPREKSDDQETILPGIEGDGSGCLHLNKSPIQTTMVQGKRRIYRTCRDCRKRINEKTKNERTSFLGAKPLPDTREGHSPEAKGRNES